MLISYVIAYFLYRYAMHVAPILLRANRSEVAEWILRVLQRVKSIKIVVETSDNLIFMA